MTETRWSERDGKTISETSRSELWLNSLGQVMREDRYSKEGWLDGRIKYGYLGNDSQIHTIRIFVYRNAAIGRKPDKSDRLVQTVEFVDDYSDSTMLEWREYRVHDTVRRLTNITSTYLGDDKRPVFSYSWSPDNLACADSGIYSYNGDTSFYDSYSRGGFGASSVETTYQGREGNLYRYDKTGRMVYIERFQSRHSYNRRKSRFIYDRFGRYLGERYEQECERCKTGWEQGGDFRRYDVRSRLKSIVHMHNGKPSLRYDLIYR